MKVFVVMRYFHSPRIVAVHKSELAATRHAQSFDNDGGAGAWVETHEIADSCIECGSPDIQRWRAPSLSDPSDTEPHASCACGFEY